MRADSETMAESNIAAPKEAIAATAEWGRCILLYTVAFFAVKSGD